MDFSGVRYSKKIMKDKNFYILKKSLYFLVNILLVTSIVFFALRLSPGDPIEKILGPQAKEIEYTALREKLNLHLDLWSQYKIFIKGIFTFDLGESLFSKKSVIDLIIARLVPTLSIAFFSIFFSSIIGVFWGTFLGIKKESKWDSVGRILTLLGLSFPIFSLAPIFVYIFSIKLQMLPVSEWGGIEHAILPILTLVVPLSSILSRVVRNRFLEEKNGPWVQVLFSKGLKPIQVYLRVLKACMPTINNVIAIQLSVVLAGTMISETIFDIPGLGSLLLDAIQGRDYPVVQGIVAYSASIYLLTYYVTEIINRFIDPRIETFE